MNYGIKQNKNLKYAIFVLRLFLARLSDYLCSPVCTYQKITNAKNPVTAGCVEPIFLNQKTPLIKLSESINRIKN